MGSRGLRSPRPHERLMLIAVIALAGHTGGIHCCRSLLERHLPTAEPLDRPRPRCGPRFDACSLRAMLTLPTADFCSVTATSRLINFSPACPGAPPAAERSA